jgi:hypothetical protein
VLLPEVVESFRSLETTRHAAVHFRPETDTNARELALVAVHLLADIVNRQFGAFGEQPWFIANIPGASYIKREYEEDSFVRTVYLPNSMLLGYRHNVVSVGPDGVVIQDDYDYGDEDLSDEEFAERIRGE